MRYGPESDVIIMSAAVADYTVAARQDRKLKKSGEAMNIEIKPTVDILRELGTSKKANQILVGFALETDHEVENATQKLRTKNLDFIVLNSLQDQGAGFGLTTNKVTIIDKQGVVLETALKTKQEIACDILDVIS
jgi:phosphopantothenoylcysteine decarboxylase/phosphopantothenate--cysteine ligase